MAERDFDVLTGACLLLASKFHGDVKKGSFSPLIEVNFDRIFNGLHYILLYYIVRGNMLQFLGKPTLISSNQRPQIDE